MADVAVDDTTLQASETLDNHNLDESTKVEVDAPAVATKEHVENEGEEKLKSENGLHNGKIIMGGDSGERSVERTERDQDDEREEHHTRGGRDRDDDRGGRHKRDERSEYGSRRGGRSGYGNGSRSFAPKKAQIKARFEDLPESSDAQEIRRQVEFYFSDSNLPIDAFLLKLTEGHANKPVPLKTIHSFKRMRHFQPYSAVRDAVKASNYLLLDDNDDITRKVPIDAKYGDDADANRSLVHSSSMGRSIYAKGFGDEGPSTHIDIETFFGPFGPLNSVRLRRHNDGTFKGSVFIEFEHEDLQKAFLELDPKPEWEGEAIQVMSKQAYVDKKNQDIHDGKVKPRSPMRQWNDRKRFSDGPVDQDDWKTRRDRDQRDGGRGRGRGRGGRGGRGGRNDDRRHRGRDDRSASPYRHRRDRDGRSPSPYRANRDKKETLPKSEAPTEADATDLDNRASVSHGADGDKVASFNDETQVKSEATGSKKRELDDADADAEGGEAKRLKEDTGAEEA